jgi:hypothetical protein
MKLVLNTVKDEIFIVHLTINISEGSDSATVFEAILLCLHDHPFLHMVVSIPSYEPEADKMTNHNYILYVESRPASYQAFPCHLSDEMIAHQQDLNQYDNKI